MGPGLGPAAAPFMLLLTGARKAEVPEVGVDDVLVGRGVHSYERHVGVPTREPEISPLARGLSVPAASVGEVPQDSGGGWWRQRRRLRGVERRWRRARLASLSWAVVLGVGPTQCWSQPRAQRRVSGRRRRRQSLPCSRPEGSPKEPAVDKLKLATRKSLKPALCVVPARVFLASPPALGARRNSESFQDPFQTHQPMHAPKSPFPPLPPGPFISPQ